MAVRLRAAVTALRALLGTVAAVVVLFGIVPAASGIGDIDYLPNGVVLPEMLQVPHPSTPRIPVQPDWGMAERIEAAAVEFPNLFPWKETPDGQVDAATGLPPVELTGPESLRLAVLAPSWWDRLSYAGPILATHALILAVVWLLWRMVDTLQGNEVFTLANAHRMMAIGLLIGGAGSLTQLLTVAGYEGILARSAAAGVVRVAWSFSWWPLVVGAVLLVLAEVFRQGVRLRDEVAGLI